MSVKKALIVGIDTYERQPLTFCELDAQEMAAVLAMPEYGFDVTILLNGDATRRNVLSSLTAIFTSEAEQVLFYFAGHGLAADFGTYLVTCDGDGIEPGIGLDHLTRLLRSERVKADAAIVFLDCCHAGAATLRGSVDRPMGTADVVAAVHSLATRRAVVAACQSTEAARETATLRHGIFTAYLIDALCGSAADGKGDISLTNVYEHVARNFEAVSGQTPVFRGDLIGRVVLGSGFPPRTTPELEEVELLRLEHQAEAMVNDYVQATAVDMERWLASEYIDACGRLEPIIRWMKSQSRHVKLKLRPRFANAFDTTQARLANLGDIVDGMSTPLGRITEKLGSGSFGTVWRVTNADARAMAYKVYHPSDLTNREKLQRFDRGFRAMKQLNHPHIVKVHQMTECPVGFTMDLIQGSNARYFVSSTPDIHDVVAQLVTVAETLQHAHARDVRHRDVKPENILLSWEPEQETYRAFLTDFDLAWFSAATQFTREGVGSFIYAAPEQIEKPRSNSAHAATTDVYSFGQLLFFMVCSRDPVPHLADNAWALSQHLVSQVSEGPCRLLVDLYDRCTRDDAAQRIPDFRTICDMLYDALKTVEGAGKNVAIDMDRFARELSFSVVGLNRSMILSPLTFVTPSGSTLVELASRDLSGSKANLVVRLQTQQMFSLQGSESKAARRSINQRIDASLEPYRFAKRHPGKQSPFETFIHVANVPVTMSGVRLTREVLTRVIDCMERLD